MSGADAGRARALLAPAPTRPRPRGGVDGPPLPEPDPRGRVTRQPALPQPLYRQRFSGRPRSPDAEAPPGRRPRDFRRRARWRCRGPDSAVHCRGVRPHPDDHAQRGPRGASRPFDRDRDGFLMAEDGAMLVLEELGHVGRRGARPCAELEGYGATNDAHHVTAPLPSGDQAALAMTFAMRKAGRARSARSTPTPPQRRRGTRPRWARPGTRSGRQPNGSRWAAPRVCTATRSGPAVR